MALQWRLFEDALLMRAVKKYGIFSWDSVSAGVGTRSAWECKQRWYHCLDPRVKKSKASSSTKVDPKLGKKFHQLKASSSTKVDPKLGKKRRINDVKQPLLDSPEPEPHPGLKEIGIFCSTRMKPSEMRLVETLTHGLLSEGFHIVTVSLEIGRGTLHGSSQREGCCCAGATDSCICIPQQHYCAGSMCTCQGGGKGSLCFLPGLIFVSISPESSCLLFALWWFISNCTILP